MALFAYHPMCRGALNGLHLAATVWALLPIYVLFVFRSSSMKQLLSQTSRGLGWGAKKKGMKKEPKEGKLSSKHRRSKLSLLRGLTFRANLERPLVVLSGSARQCKLLAVNAHAFASLECKELWGNELCFSHLIAPWRLPFYFQGGEKGSVGLWRSFDS